MKPLIALLLLFALTAIPAGAQQADGELTQIKEQELVEVREKISALKKSLDESASARDRVAAELQKAEIAIAEQRSRLKELERQRDQSTRRKAELDARLAAREAELDEEAAELAEQVRAAYMNGNQ